MQVFRRLPPIADRTDCALTIGNFDGVHLGHQALLARLRADARARGLPVCVLTFEPHPREYFASLGRGSAPPRISTQRDKLQALAEGGVDRVCVAHFNASLAALDADAFIEQVLVDGLRVRSLLIGDDFRFGAGRRGDFDMLRRAAGRHGFDLARMDTVVSDGERVSSSAVRVALGAGDLDRAASLLGRPYTVSGHVLHGRKLGRTLGFPTMNLAVPSGPPAVAGVFVVRVHGLGAAPVRGVASLGTRPAVERNGRLLLEVHAFDFSGDAYGRVIRVEFLRKLRDEAHYDSLEALTAQIRRDTDDARRHFDAADGTATRGGISRPEDRPPPHDSDL